MWLRAGIAGAVAFGLVFAGSVALAGGASAADSSQTTVRAKDAGQDADWANSPMPDLAVTVSQTRDLQAQAIKISWTGGGAGSTRPSGGSGGENFLQVMQCWGNVKLPDGSLGPDRTTCQFGGFGTAGATRDANRDDPAAIAPADRLYSYVGAGGLDVSYTGVPFKAAVIDPDTGSNTVIAKIDAEGQKIPGVDLNTNQFFTKYTTNEVPWAGSGADGTGVITFETQTALESPGLGCGAAQTATDGAVTGQPCWLVVIPRGAGTNAGSPLFAETWAHRLAIKLDFQPVGEHCAIGAVEQQLAGSELATDAVSSWQPTLCSAQGGNAYTLLTTTDKDAAASANTVPDAPLALTTRPLPLAEGETDNLTYAPIALTGVTVTFAIDRVPDDRAPDDAKARARLPFTDMKLTPRLLAKLLTSSYSGSVPTSASYLADNPRNLLFDPDFLAINDEDDWRYQAIINPGITDIMVTQGQSGYAAAIWEYILADPEARDFLAGKPDPWGMKVNHYASTDPERNPNGSAFALPRNDFPKVDPSESGTGTPQALNSVTWRPFISDLAAGAYLTLRGDGQTLGDWDPNAQPPKYTKNARRLVGERSVIALTDTSAAMRYDTVTAQLRNPAGVFVAPTADALSAAAAAMTPNPAQPQVLTFDPASSQAQAATSAYPLALPVYAATNVALGSQSVRESYASFIAYASDKGQTPGVLDGQLPPGYAPMPSGWRIQAQDAAVRISGGIPAAPTTPSGAGAAASGGAGSAPAAPAPAAPAPVSDPAASGAPAAALSSGATPDDPDLGPLTSALPLSLLAGVAAAGAVPFIGRLRRP